MEILKFGKLAALALAVSIAAGCSSSDGDAAGEGAVDPNAGYNAGANGSGGLDSSYLSDEAALRAITVFYFEFDKYDLKPEAMRAMDVHARDLKASGQRVVLAGHTDERGTREYNMALGERRANAAQRYLILQGVSPAQIEAVSYGEERPVALGSTEEAWAQNRRVEMTK